MAKSYFTILGVTTYASADEIRSAYRRLAKAYHPDHYAGDSSIFRQIQEAYSILGDAHRRAEYERALLSAAKPRQFIRPSGHRPEPLVPEHKTVDLGEISPLRSFQTFTPSFDQVFDWLWDNFSSIDRPKLDRVKSLTLEVPLTKAQAAAGGTARVLVPARAVCPVCRGSGGIDFYECTRCAGEGAISGEVPVSLSFPAGLRHDHAVVLSLERFGIRNLRVTVLFRPTDAR